MPISEQHRFAYIHIPKTAGTSLMQAMRSAEIDLIFAERGLWDLIHGRSDLADILQTLRMCFRLSTFTEFPQQHLPARVLRALTGEERWEKYFRFTFVRNPWDLVVSSYHFAKKHFSPSQFPAEPDVYAFLSRCDSFESFVRGFVAIRCDMTSFFEDEDGRILVDFIGRFETFESDVAYIAQRVGATLLLPHENASDHVDYRDYYTKSTKNIVRDHFARDIERFNYSF